jgi:3-hydroxyisobutyrate dehydrogenase/glyoxylate/succinic semialdehyde reductase
MGTSLKMVVNALLAQAMLAFSESVALGEALGISRDKLFEILIGGPVVAPFVKGKQDLIADGTFDPAFPLKWMAKDLHLATLSAYEQGVAMPGAALAEQIYALAARQGWADRDFSAIYAFVNEVNT